LGNQRGLQRSAKALHDADCIELQCGKRLTLREYVCDCRLLYHLHRCLLHAYQTFGTLACKKGIQS
jgi:hypothetical protein